MAACAAPLVGILAQNWFGFSGDAKITGNRGLDLSNARAMGSALLAFTTGARGVLCVGPLLPVGC